jgi:hypothetical protein
MADDATRAAMTQMASGGGRPQSAEQAEHARQQAAYVSQVRERKQKSILV